MYIRNLYSIFFVLLVVAGSSLSAESSKQKQVNLQKEIKSANANLQSSRAVSEKFRKNVRVAEDKLNELSRDLHQTEKSINHLTSKLTKSNKREEKLQKQTNEQKKALTQQMQALYTSGKQSHLRLLLKQDDPSDISRTVKYFEYMNQYRLKQIKKVKKRLNKIKQVKKQIAKDSSSLKKLQLIQSEKKLALKSTVTEKDRLLKKQSKVVRSREQKLSKLKRDESRLRGVIRKLAQKQKREELERENAKAKIKVKPAVTITKNTNTKNIKNSKSVDRHYVPNTAFSSLRGKLSWPVRGRLTHKYGSARNSKIKWNGVIISAAGGTNVHAVARGKIEFSGRLNGYGYVIIIRHDRNYRSLYAYNRSVYKRVGQVVKAGEIIAAVGNSGRLASPGLYFEISKGSVHQNPARWCR